MKVLLLLSVAVTLSFAQWGGGGKNLNNDYTKKMVSNREIYVYAPANLAAKSPLLLSFHGMDQDPSYQQSNTHWEEVADTAGFVVVYPQAEGKSFDTWDIKGDKETKWIVQIIDQMAKDYDIDTKRVYMSGFSMGGMLTYHAMSYIADKIAAFAPCSGWRVYGPEEAMRPVPIFHPHGDKDDVVNYSGLDEFLKNYRDQFHCPAKAEVTENYPNSENTATLYSWGPCDEGVYVKHLKLHGRQHSPSKAEVSDIWNFVKEYSLDGSSVKPPIVVPTDRDSVFNGSFSDSLKLAGWKLNSYGGEGSLKLTEGMAEINVTKVAENAYGVQMIQNGIHYEKGESYKLTFEAYATQARTLEVNVEKDTDPWTSYLGEAKTFELGTEKKTFEIEFVMNEATDDNGRVSFNAGLFTGSVFIDNVVLTKKGGTDKVGAANVVMNLNGEKTFKVFDTKGSFICNIKLNRFDDVQVELKSMNLGKGLYIVRGAGINRIVPVR